jgi:hypothetical protein
MSPPSLALVSNRFTVSYFSCVGMTQKCREKSFTVPFDENVSKLYLSGDKTERKSVFKKYIWIFLGIVLFIYAAWSYFNHVREEVSPLPKYKDIKKSHSDIKKSLPVESSISDNTYFLHFSCVDDVCSYKDLNVPFSFVTYLIKNSNPFFKKSFYHDYKQIDYMLVVDESAYNLFANSFMKQDSKSKNNDMKDTSISLFGDKK